MCALLFISLMGTPYIIFDNTVYSNTPIPGMTTTLVIPEIMDSLIAQNEVNCHD
jgi:hypothetical protein